MEQLSSFVLASILLTLTPGPDLLMVIAKSLEKGVTKALYFIADVYLTANQLPNRLARLSRATPCSSAATI